MFNVLVRVLLSMVSVTVLACAGFQVQDDLTTEIAISNGARGLGYAIARADNPYLAEAVSRSYALMRRGGFSESDMTSLVSELNTAGEQMLAYAALDLLRLMGAKITAQQTVVDLSGIPVRLWDVAERSYSQGYRMGMLDRAAGVTRRVP